MVTSRRNVIGGGLSVLALADVGEAQDRATAEQVAKSLMSGPRAEALDTPALRGNILAFTFKQPPTDLVVPKVKLERRSGLHGFQPEPGLTLMSLWAPWCAPCLLELKDLAEQQRLYASKRFRILPILTGTRDPITLAEAQGTLEKAGVRGLEAVVDRSPASDSLFEQLTRRETPGGSIKGLPCNLLIDARGKVLARQFGAPLDLPRGTKPTPEMRANARSMWMAADGHALLKALRDGEIAGSVARAS